MSITDNANNSSGDRSLRQSPSEDSAWSRELQDMMLPGTKIDKSGQSRNAVDYSNILPMTEIIGMPNSPVDTQQGSVEQAKSYDTEAGVKVTLGADGKPSSYNSKGFTFEKHSDGWYYHQDSGGKHVPIEEPTVSADGTVHTTEKGGLFNDGRPHSLDGDGQKTGAPAPGADGLPVPGGGYGSYHFGYEFSTSDNWTQEDLSREIQENYNKYFIFTGDQASIVPGETINMKLPPAMEALGLKAPVKVIAANENGFAFESLPGHFEGAGRTIVFRFVPKESDTPGRKNWGLEISAGGPVSEASLLPGNSLGSKGVWEIFENNLNNRLPNSPN